MKKYWFKPKRFGYGFYPISIEGWLSTFLLIVLLYISTQANSIGSKELVTKDELRFVLDVFILAGLFVVLFKDKVDGELGWRWGSKK